MARRVSPGHASRRAGHTLRRAPARLGPRGAAPAAGRTRGRRTVPARARPVPSDGARPGETPCSPTWAGMPAIRDGGSTPSNDRRNQREYRHRPIHFGQRRVIDRYPEPRFVPCPAIESGAGRIWSSAPASRTASPAAGSADSSSAEGRPGTADTTGNDHHSSPPINNAPRRVTRRRHDLAGHDRPRGPAPRCDRALRSLTQ